MHQFGLGCIKNVHVDQSEYHFGTSLIHFGVVIFGNSLIHFGTAYVLFRVVIFGTVLFRVRFIRYSVNSHLQPKAMADRTRDGGVEERTEGQRLLLYKGVLVRALNLHRHQTSLARTGERWKIPRSRRILRIKKGFCSTFPLYMYDV